ncbi:MAG: TIGR02206 family membrane protein [Clostridia bacterium]|nr:TIGR02206 family membrane protein [Clostridia bacterium]
MVKYKCICQGLKRGDRMYPEYFFSYETDIPAQAGYSFFDATHLVWMFASFLMVVILVLIYKKSGDGKKKTIMSVVAIILLLCEVARNGWLICIDKYSLSESLPLQLSRIMVYVEAAAIFTGKRPLKEFAYACGLFSIAAFIAPDIMRYPIFHIHTIRYSVAHILIMSVPFMWIIGDGFRPDVRQLPKCALLLLVIAGAATAANFAFGGNYLHIHYIPVHVNIELNQPWYAMALCGVIIGFWFLTYIPWIILEHIETKKNKEQ